MSHFLIILLNVMQPTEPKHCRSRLFNFRLANFAKEQCLLLHLSALHSKVKKRIMFGHVGLSFSMQTSQPLSLFDCN